VAGATLFFCGRARARQSAGRKKISAPIAFQSDGHRLGSCGHRNLPVPTELKSCGLKFQTSALPFEICKDSRKSFAETKNNPILPLDKIWAIFKNYYHPNLFFRYSRFFRHFMLTIRFTCVDNVVYPNLILTYNGGEDR
jgi:hypothetical protein